MKRKTLITKCGYSWGDFAPTHTINPWLGCTFNCDYCWARDWWWKRMQGPLRKAWNVPDWFKWQNPVLFNGWKSAIEEELHSRRWPANTRVLLCSMTDPYIPQEKEMRVTQRILELLGQANLPTMMLTKAIELPARDFRLLKSIDAWFGVTLDGELGVAGPNERRILLLHRAHVMGIKTFVSLEPWIPGVDATKIVGEVATPMVNHWIIGRLNYKGVGDEFYRLKLPGLIRLLDLMGASYYIKPDLMRCLQE